MQDSMIADIYRTLGELNSKADQVLSTQHKIDEKIELHGKRLSSLEKWKTKVIATTAAVVGAVQVAWIIIGFLWNEARDYVLHRP